jgi:hypothetical protein
MLRRQCRHKGGDIAEFSVHLPVARSDLPHFFTIPFTALICQPCATLANAEYMQVRS